MPECAGFEHGMFSWVDLGTSDLPPSKNFYSGLFGWVFDDNTLGRDVYAIARANASARDAGCVVAAIYNTGNGWMSNRTQWTSYITVDDVDATVKKIARNGGRVLKEPNGVLDAGRTALVEDPGGGVFALWKAKRHIGACLVDEPGSLMWNELVTNDATRAKEFYFRSIGWKARAVDVGREVSEYSMLTRDGSTQTGSAGLVPMGARALFGAQWVPYFGVTDCAAAVKKAQSLGGRVLHPVSNVPGVGRFAILQDPQAATFGVLQKSAPTKGQLDATLRTAKNKKKN